MLYNGIWRRKKAEKGDKNVKISSVIFVCDAEFISSGRVF